MELVILILIALPFLYIYYFTRKKTKIFNVYAHSTKGYAAVKDGLAWLAAPLNPLWFFHRSLWSLFFTYIVLFFIAAAIDIELYSDKEMVLFFNYASDLDWLWIVIQVIVFFLLPLIKGNDWTSKNLIKKGYFFQDSIAASTKKDAIALVIANQNYSSDEKTESLFKKSKKSISQSLSGLGFRDQIYSETLNLCLRRIREKADEMDIDLSDYYNTSNANSFQEESILFFLANAAVTANNKEHSIVKMGVRDQKALNKILNEFLRNNGIRGMDLISSMEPPIKSSLVQGAYGKDYILAKNNSSKADSIMTNFVQSLVSEIPYGNKYNDLI